VGRNKGADPKAQQQTKHNETKNNKKKKKKKKETHHHKKKNRITVGYVLVCGGSVHWV